MHKGIERERNPREWVCKSVLVKDMDREVVCVCVCVCVSACVRVRAHCHGVRVWMCLDVCVRCVCVWMCLDVRVSRCMFNFGYHVY